MAIEGEAKTKEEVKSGNRGILKSFISIFQISKTYYLLHDAGEGGKQSSCNKGDCNCHSLYHFIRYFRLRKRFN
jgi:hypothetical protein